MKSGSVPCVSYDVSFSGNATFAIDLGADLTFSYDRADIVPGGAVPIQVTYTPTNDPTHEVTVNAAADVSLSTESPLSVLIWNDLSSKQCAGGVVAAPRSGRTG